jgi:hypothetical protein
VLAWSAVHTRSRGADWAIAGAHYSRERIFGGPSFRPAPILAWVVGFLVYEWLYQPTGLGFWSRWMGELPTPSHAIGASVPGFGVAFLLTAAFGCVGSARAAARARREPLVRPR